MSGTLLEVARSGDTADPYISRISLARMINQALGGAFVAPWDVDELTDDFIDTILAMATELPKMRKGLNEVASIFEQWRSKHPTYRK